MRIVGYTFLMFTCLIGSSVIASEQAICTNKAVLITGASSGIGRSTAEYLAEQGYLIYAGARKDEDMASLNSIKNITAVRLDVTKQEDIDSAVTMIKDKGCGLWGLVNNAGVMTVAPMTATQQSDVEFIYQVNVFGIFRTTKAFAPLLLESYGRIVNVSSISGVMSGPTYGMYSSTKHAVEAITDSTAIELGEHGVHVSAVNPGNFPTQLGNTYCKRVESYLAGQDWGLFEETRKSELEYCAKEAERETSPDPAKANTVAKTIKKALFEENPRERYLAFDDPLDASWTVAVAMGELLRMNYAYEGGFEHHELIKLMEDLTPYFSGKKIVDTKEQAAYYEGVLERWISDQKKTE